MTCIAYKDGLLATDRQVTHNCLIGETNDKIFIVNDTTIMAFAGFVSLGYVFADWCSKGYKREDWPLSTEIPNRCNFVALVMKTDTGTLDYWDDILFPIPLDPKIYHGYGSGREIAVGTMCYGGSPIDAVRSANKHLDDCGFGVSYVDGNNKPLEIFQELKGEKHVY